MCKDTEKKRNVQAFREKVSNNILFLFTASHPSGHQAVLLKRFHEFFREKWYNVWDKFVPLHHQKVKKSNN